MGNGNTTRKLKPMSLEERRMQAAKIASYDHYAPKLYSYSIPIFLPSRNGILQHEGTGFFIRFKGEVFFVTAKHVLVPDGSPQPARRPTIYTDPFSPSSTLSTNSIVLQPPICDEQAWVTGENEIPERDILAVKIHRLEKLGNLNTVVLDENQLRDDLVPTNGGLHLISATPSSKSETRNWEPKLIRSEVRFLSVININPDLHGISNLTHADHIFLGFEQEGGLDQDGNEVILPSPAGLSGAPVWHLASPIGMLPPLEPVVAGLFLEWRREISSLVAIRSHHILSFLDAIHTKG